MLLGIRDAADSPESNLLDWSVSHRQLGFTPIHVRHHPGLFSLTVQWLARDQRVGLWVDSVKHLARGASRDTFRHAPPVRSAD